MIPSRGLRWSGQAIAIGRRRIEVNSARKFSSSTVQQSSIRSSPLFSSARTSFLRSTFNNQLLKTNIIRNGAGIRFASTTPIAAAPITPAAPPPVEAVSATIPPAESLPSFDETVDLMSSSLYDIPAHIGYLKELGLDYGWGPTALVEWTLEHIHVFAGTPWWATITLTAVAFRLIMLRPMIQSAENATKLAVIAPITTPIRNKMRAASGDMETVMACRRELALINKRAGIKMWQSFVPMLQIFTGYGSFVLLRGMAKLPVPGFETGGLLWFSDLSIPDPYFILPVVTSFIMHWVFRKGGEAGVQTMTPQVMKMMMWGLPGISLIFTSFLPASVQVSFLVTGILSYLQSAMFRSTWMRTKLNLTPMPTKPKAGEAPPSPYKGTLKTKASPVLSQSDLNARYSSGKSGISRFQGTTINATSQVVEEQSIIGKAVGKVTGQMKDTIKGVQKAGSDAVEQARDTMGGSKEKQVRKEAEAYEKKRREEEAEEMRERAKRESERRLRKRKAPKEV